ncbi:uncharacterized protein LOC125683130 [Ostrea edulis]|uniref:uncharacterized protein LOC125683130 n=1 Tax=Ostrea edulis TaxID=37623 RepID=UPI00209611A4|nr:uncharacterized protein LOC125683130 [Ostrea edulis]XP_055996339.1 uncharacterized protein LOC125683130 [Ostrea edulis]XP_055996340.1 uncharacterized protein LOC125683130 [Ostrea edulis]XP_055996341.1 uncharacterized protein LOC125683130 [Ostrea edulis]
MAVTYCVLVLFLAAGVSANITGQHVTSGECVCITGTNVNARTSAGLSASVGATLNTGDCFKIHGGVLTRDGYKWFELTHVSGTQNLWVAGTLLSKAAASYCSAGSSGSGSCTTNTKNLACQLLQMHTSGTIHLWNRHPSGVHDNAYALNNIKDTCNGHQASRSHYTCSECRSPGAPGGHVCLSESLLRYLVELGTHGYIHVNEIAGACHSCHSHHYQGTAVDLDPGSRKHEFMSKCTSMGGWALDEINHIHCQFDH